MFWNGQADPGMRPLIDFFVWLVGAGLAMPLYISEPNLGGYAGRYRLTSAGERFLQPIGARVTVETDVRWSVTV
jgi:hypothetical protein